MRVVGDLRDIKVEMRVSDERMSEVCNEVKRVGARRLNLHNLSSISLLLGIVFGIVIMILGIPAVIAFLSGHWSEELGLSKTVTIISIVAFLVLIYGYVKVDEASRNVKYQFKIDTDSAWAISSLFNAAGQVITAFFVDADSKEDAVMTIDNGQPFKIKIGDELTEESTLTGIRVTADGVEAIIENKQFTAADRTTNGKEVYRHFKGGVYEVVCEALDVNDDTLQTVHVIYKSLKDGKTWSRLKEDFISEAPNREGVTQKYRFERIR